ncbi:MAG: LysE family transporter [Planctomycetes bacterium]|nr:LysE family transporter [Planctomycetota bacterium]
MHVLLKGLAIGFFIAIPVGPVAILCIQRTLTRSKRHGLISGLGAATADAMYGAVAAFGLTMVSAFVQAHRAPFRLGGGLILCLLAVRTFFGKVQKQPEQTDPKIHATNFVSAFLLTLMNPLTILAFMAVFTGSGLGHCQRDEAVWLILGVFLGSSLWFLSLSFLAGQFKQVVNEDRMGIINKIAACLILAFGFFVMLRH